MASPAAPQPFRGGAAGLLLASRSNNWRNLLVPPLAETVWDQRNPDEEADDPAPHLPGEVVHEAVRYPAPAFAKQRLRTCANGDVESQPGSDKNDEDTGDDPLEMDHSDCRTNRCQAPPQVAGPTKAQHPGQEPGEDHDDHVVVGLLVVFRPLGPAEEPVQQPVDHLRPLSVVDCLIARNENNRPKPEDFAP